MIVHRHTIQGNEAAHGGTGDDGILPVRQGAVGFVNVGLQLLHHPVHHHAALTLDVTVLGIGVGHGCVLHKTAVAFMVALHGNDN